MAEPECYKLAFDEYALIRCFGAFDSLPTRAKTRFRGDWKEQNLGKVFWVGSDEETLLKWQNSVEEIIKAVMYLSKIKLAH